MSQLTVLRADPQIATTQDPDAPAASPARLACGMLVARCGIAAAENYFGIPRYRGAKSDADTQTVVMTLRYSHLSQGHKKRAVGVVGKLMSGDFLETLPQKVAVGQDGPVAQVIDIVGAEGGGRTLTGTSPKGF
jgi:hypothetical protein